MESHDRKSELVFSSRDCVCLVVRLRPYDVTNDVFSFLFVSSFTVFVLTIWQPTCTVPQPTVSFLWRRVTRASPVFSRALAIQRSFFSRYFISREQDGEHKEYRCVFERPPSFFPLPLSSSFIFFSLHQSSLLFPPNEEGNRIDFIE